MSSCFIYFLYIFQNKSPRFTSEIVGFCFYVFEVFNKKVRKKLRIFLLTLCKKLRNMYLQGGNMKRKDIEKILKSHGFELVEGGNHTHICKNGKYISSLSRQKEIDNKVVYKIQKQTGVQLLK